MAKSKSLRGPTPPKQPLPPSRSPLRRAKEGRLRRPDARVLDALFATVKKRRRANSRGSYTAKLFEGGLDKIGGKVIEEAAETVAAALNETPARIAAESADVLYHLLVLWAAAKVKPGHVWAELARREGISGIAEKKSRKKKMKV